MGERGLRSAALAGWMGDGLDLSTTLTFHITITTPLSPSTTPQVLTTRNSKRLKQNRALLPPPPPPPPPFSFLATLFSSDLGISSSSSWPRLGLVPRICSLSLSLSLFRPLPPLHSTSATKGSLLALQMNGENVSQLAEAARQ